MHLFCCRVLIILNDKTIINLLDKGVANEVMFADKDLDISVN